MIVFGFKENISEKIIQSLKLSESKKYYLSDIQSIEDLVLKVSHFNPKYILGIGSYSGIDKDQLRIETLCTNKFRNKYTNGGLEKLEINYFIKPNSKFKIANGMGNSYCNLTSYLLMKNIKENKLQTKYTFIHVPKDFDFKKALEIIQEVLD